MNGDVLTDLDYAEFFDWHCREGAGLSIGATEREQYVDFGVLTSNSSDEVVGFQEKPTLRYLVSMGIYGLNRRVLDWLPPDEQDFRDNKLVTGRVLRVSGDGVSCSSLSIGGTSRAPRMPYCVKLAVSSCPWSS